jgi:Putative Flp pilus-assembly TadE/G-like
MSGPIRNKVGSLLILPIVVTCLVIVPLLLGVSQISMLLAERVRIQNAVEAACLLAANDVSRIVINDPTFGYVSLSNYPPVGKATCALDGEPLPVIGINTLVGTIRQNTIIARNLDNDIMLSLADADRVSLGTTIKGLNKTLADALGGSGKAKFVDIQGDRVDPVNDVKALLKENLPNNVSIESIKLSNGWLTNGGGSTISIPQPEKLAEVKPDQIQTSKYKPFIEIKVDKRSFTFAGLGSTASLVKESKFKPADDKHICSIVNIDCVVSVDNLWDKLLPIANGSHTKLHFTACCEPYSNPDIGPPGVMTLRFSGASVPGMQSWNDLLNAANFQDNQVSTYDVVGGDYPSDPAARMNQYLPNVQPGTAQQFSEHLYYWLRNGHLRPRIDAVLAMLDDPFSKNPLNGIYIYEFDRGGHISRRILARDPFPVGVTSESQFSATSNTTIQNGLSPVIVFRNNVKNLGTASGGKHAGQPLPGYPLNWCELQEFGCDEQAALNACKGRLGTKLTLVDPEGWASPSEAISNVNYNLFKTFDGKTLFMQPRRSFYSGGLALDIEIGGTRFMDPMNDVLSMQKLRLARKI